MGVRNQGASRDSVCPWACGLPASSEEWRQPDDLGLLSRGLKSTSVLLLQSVWSGLRHPSFRPTNARQVPAVHDGRAAETDHARHALTSGVCGVCAT